VHLPTFTCIYREGVCGGVKIFGSALLQPARSVCVSLSAFSHFIVRQHAVYAERDIVMAHLSACLSVTFWYCNGNECTCRQIFHRLNVVFSALAPLQNSKENSLIGVLNTGEVEKICDFRPKSSFISETARDSPWLLRITNITNRKS